MATYSKPTDSNFARQNGGSTVDRAKRTAEEVKDLAVDKARTEVESRAMEGKEKAASKLGGIAQALRAGGDELGSDFAGNYIGKAAQQIESLTDYVQTKDLPEIVSDVERFARREPAIFLGGSFALGLLAARFLKSTSRRREELELDLELHEDDFEAELSMRPLRPQVRDIARPPQAATGLGATTSPSGGISSAPQTGAQPGLGGMTNTASQESPRKPDLSGHLSGHLSETTPASYGIDPTQYGTTPGSEGGTRGTGGTGGSGTGGGTP